MSVVLKGGLISLRLTPPVVQFDAVCLKLVSKNILDLNQSKSISLPPSFCDKLGEDEQVYFEMSLVTSSTVQIKSKHPLSQENLSRFASELINLLDISYHTD